MSGILVTGGTGLVGSHLLYKLCSNGIKVRALLRKESDNTIVKNIFKYYSPGHESIFSNIEWVEGDITDIVQLEHAMAGITHVYHCAALVSFNKDQHALLDKINTEGTANVVNVALHVGVTRLIHVSSIAAIGRQNTGNAIIDENSPWKYSKKTTSRYSLSKYNTEREVWRGIEEGLQAAIINPGVVMGPCDWNKNTGVMFKNSWNGLKYYTEGRTGFVDVRDVVNAMVLLMNSDKNAERYILVGKNSTYKELLDSIALVMNKKPPVRKAGPLLVSIARRWEAFISKLTSREPRITKETARSAFSNYTFDGSKIQSAVSFSYTPFNETLKNTWEFIKRNYV
jgi:dihydroflavonol-4-reductase